MTSTEAAQNQPHYYYNSSNPDEPRKAIFQPPLSTQRYSFVESFLMKKPDIRCVADLGCGNGRMVYWLRTIPHLEKIKFVDIDMSDSEFDLANRFCPGLSEILLGRSNSRIPLDIEVIQADMRKPEDLLRADCMILIEVIEHLQRNEIDSLADLIFAFYKPNYVIITTPNRDFNVLLWDQETSDQKFRHDDHKFEFTKREFENWVSAIVDKYTEYSVAIDGVGHLDKSEPLGPATQIAIFTRLVDQDNSQPPETNQTMIACNEAQLMTTFHIKGGVNPTFVPESFDWQEAYSRHIAKKDEQKDSDEEDYEEDEVSGPGSDDHYYDGEEEH